MGCSDGKKTSTNVANAWNSADIKNTEKKVKKISTLIKRSCAIQCEHEAVGKKNTLSRNSSFSLYIVFTVCVLNLLFGHMIVYPGILGMQ